MYRYIKTDKQKRDEQEQTLLRPLYLKIKSLYDSKTGFYCNLRKWSYLENLNSAAFTIFQDIDYTVFWLVHYDRPSRIKQNDVSIISVDASSEKISEYVNKMIMNLKEILTRPRFRDMDIDELLRTSRIYNRQTAYDFVKSLRN